MGPISLPSYLLIFKSPISRLLNSSPSIFLAAISSTLREMSSEIAPALDRIMEIPSAYPSGKHSNALVCRSQEDIRPLDLLQLGWYADRGVKADLVAANHEIRHLISPDKGHKYVTQFRPTPYYIQALLKEIKEPSLLLLRGCDLLLRSNFPFDSFKTLTALEISGITHLTTLPVNEIAQMTQLQTLNFSHLPITQLPGHDFFSKLVNLRSIVICGCSRLQVLPKFPQLTALQSLTLSDLLIEELPEGFFSDIKQLHWVILRGCSKLRFLPSIECLENLEVLDLSHCSSLVSSWVCPRYFRILDLSYTASLPSIPVLNHYLTHLFLRDTKVSELSFLQQAKTLHVLDLSGAHNLRQIDQLQEMEKLEALDLSRTGIESIESISDLNELRYLILKECTRLVRVPTMENQLNLEVLDLSGCELLGDLPIYLCDLDKLKELNISRCDGLKRLREDVFDEMPCLEKLDLSKTNINHLPSSFANLTNLRTLNISHTPVEQVPGLSNFVNLKEFFYEDCQKLKTLTNLEKLDLDPSESGEKDYNRSMSKPNEFHLVSTFLSFPPSGFQRFRKDFKVIFDLISDIQKKFNSTSSPDTIIDIKPQAFKRHIRSMDADLKYILENITLLESSRNCTDSDEILHELMHVADRLQADDFPIESPNLDELIRMVAKLKVLVLPKGEDGLDKGKNQKKKKKPLYWFKRKNADDDIESDIDINTPAMQNLLCSYESLTDTQRKCLLYFAAFPCPGYFLIEERILINLWYGEGFIDSGVENENTIEEIGQQIMLVLTEKSFIRKFRDENREQRVCCMYSDVHAFVTVQAKAERFFNFNHRNGQLTPQLTGSRRACLLKSQDKFPSSNKLWMNYTNSYEKIKRFKDICTLLNVNEPVIDIKAEWFSKMMNLFVLHLGNWEFDNEEPIDVLDLNFLEELKKLKQLRLLSLEGLLAIRKLPDSVCKLGNLKILSLRNCAYLEGLPAGIGSLKNLTHLDLTQCCLLPFLPESIRLLEKLEVLKGFVITYESGGEQNRKACILKDLLKLKRLRKLNLLVNKDKFPNLDDVQVLKEMRNLCNLKITWQKNYSNEQEPQQALKSSIWQRLKCWEKQDDSEEPLRRSNHLDNLKKLVLCCFPLETAPNWLHPSELQKLEKLYILGGNLKTLSGDANQNTWNVKVLRLKYLSNLDMDWDVLRHIFPNTPSLQKFI